MQHPIFNEQLFETTLPFEWTSYVNGLTERFVLTNVKIETIDKWRVKKAKRDSGKGKDAGR